MSTTTPTVQETAGPTNEQFEVVDTAAKPVYNVRNVAKDTIYTVIVNADGHATSCSCPHHKYRTTFCKHMATVEESIAASGGEERVTGPYTGYDCYGNVDHTYWRCERCGAEATREDALTDCC